MLVQAEEKQELKIYAGRMAKAVGIFSGKCLTFCRAELLRRCVAATCNLPICREERVDSWYENSAKTGAIPLRSDSPGLGLVFPGEARPIQAMHSNA
jgi:hypothetical protein